MSRLLDAMFGSFLAVSTVIVLISIAVAFVWALCVAAALWKIVLVIFAAWVLGTLSILSDGEDDCW